MTIREFMRENFKHFNAAVCVDAAEAWVKLLGNGGKMFLTLAGAMSTAELGIVLAELIRKEKVHAICSTGANLEEDIFNLVAHDHYVRVPHYRDLRPEDETRLLERGLNRVTDTCIPEDTAIRRVEFEILKIWQNADRSGQDRFPYEYIYELLRSGVLQEHYEIDPRNSWVAAASEADIPILTPGWEDSTLGNVFVAKVLRKQLSRYDVVKSGAEQMGLLVDWYRMAAKQGPIGFFQIGGGIAGDFPICVVPLLVQDLKEDVPRWRYFCQISDSTTSYGSYSGAVPNEKITWGKLDEQTPRFVIESDASIVAPLIFQYVLDCHALQRQAGRSVSSSRGAASPSPIGRV